MSGEVKVRKSDWQRTLAAVLLGCLLDGVLMYLFLRRVELTGLARGIVAALGAYVLFRLFYPMLRGLFPGGGERTLLWHVTPDTLVLGREEIPRGAIKAVHCWPNRDALGHAGAGWAGVCREREYGRPDADGGFRRPQRGVRRNPKTEKSHFCFLLYNIM